MFFDFPSLIGGEAIVPRYHFNVLDGTAYIDKTGAELAEHR